MAADPQNGTETPPPAPRDVPADAPTGCPGVSSTTAGNEASCAGCPNQQSCASGEGAKALDGDVEAIARRLKDAVKHKILILSGKGGVGKSTVATQLSMCLSGGSGLEVGLLDVDVCGPSIPQMVGCVGEEVRMSGSGWSPVWVEEGFGVMSIGFMLGGVGEAVIWRGARKSGLIRQFLRDVDWGELDYLVVDAPPGTSDEHITLVQLMKGCDVDGAVIVTTPQEVSLSDVRKEVDFCRKSGTRVIGVVENMAGFVCEHCEGCTDIFWGGSGGAEKMCEELGVTYLGKVPLDPRICRAGELGKSLFKEGQGKESPGVKALRGVVKKVREIVEEEEQGTGKTKTNGTST